MPEPIVFELPPSICATDALQAVSDLPHCLFLDSAVTHDQRGRYSYVAADPFKTIDVPRPVDRSLDPLSRVTAAMAELTSTQIEDLPRFQGGAAGLFGYELGRSLEVLPEARYHEFDIPVMALGLYDVVIAFDHSQTRSWIISQGWPHQEPGARHQHAQRRLEFFRQRIMAGKRPAASPAPSTITPLSGPHQRVDASRELYSNFSPQDYLRAVQRAIDYIAAGDIFQVNLAQRLVCRAKSSSLDLYLAMRQHNPAPFAGYLDLGKIQIISASPERLIHLADRQVETRPIKGTRRRAVAGDADLFVSDDLRQSEKDRAENIMIVDLMRNDLSRVCVPASVSVSQLCAVETYEYVQHLVSAVTGTLAAGQTAIDLIRAVFPGGSITGAPKIRAMEIIAEIEPHVRGAYCGSLGYVNSDGSLDMSILIRTITAAGGWWQLPVGGGIVAQSDPQTELQETWHKAEGLLRGIDSAATMKA